MLLKTILLFCLFVYFHCASSSSEADMEPSSTNVKEITVSIEHNSDDRNSTDDTKKNSPSKRTRANLLLNSKVIYPPGAKSASAFNQGILKFQQLVDIPLNNTKDKDDIGELKNNKLEEANNHSAEMDSDSKNVTKIDEKETNKTSNCGNSTLHVEGGDSLKILKNEFIQDFGTTGENILDIISNKNRTEEPNAKISNKTEEVELVEPVSSKNISLSETDKKNGAIEILDDDLGTTSNSTDDKTQTFTGNRSSYLPAERKSSDSKIVEVKPQKLEEIPLNLNLKNSARKEDRSDEDDISQNIKRDILLGNLNPFFSNPSTNSIRNTNSIFFDDMLKKTRGLVGPTNPFVVNSMSFESFKPSTSQFSKLKAAPQKSSGSVKTLKSIALSEESSSNFGTKLGGRSSTLGGFSSSSISSPKKVGQTARTGSNSSTVRGRRPGYSRFRNKQSKPSKGTTVETVQSVHLGDGKKDTSINFASTSSFGSQKSSVKTVPSLLIKQENDGPKFSSKYQSKPSAVSSASFSFTPGAPKARSYSRTKSVSTYSRTKSHSKPAPSYSKPTSSSSGESAEGIEILKSVDYALPEEVGKSLTKTGPAKFKRKAAFESKKVPDFTMQESVTVDPILLNFDMSHNPQDDSFNPYVVNSQMRPVKRNTEKSRSFEFKPSQPESKTKLVKEFNLDLHKKTLSQPMLQFKTEEETPRVDFEMFDASDYGSDDEGVDYIQNIGSDMLLKQYFATPSPTTFHTTKTMNSGRIPRSFNIPSINHMVTEAPRSFEMPAASTFRYFGNIQIIDLS